MTLSGLFSELDGQIFLDTASSSSSGHFPKPANFYIQVFPNASYEALLSHHREAMEIFTEKGCHSFGNSPLYARSEFTRIEHMVICNIMRYPLWATQAVFWSLSNRGKKYRKSIQEQLDSRMIAIPPISL